jgi:hypothetical protein
MLRSLYQPAGVALAIGFFALSSVSALAASNSAAPGTQINAGGISAGSQPPECRSGIREAHFILNGMDTTQSVALVGTPVQVTFSNGTGANGFVEQGGVGNDNDEAFIVVPLNSNTATVTSAFFVVPTVAGKIDATHPLIYGEFNLSGGDCNGTTTGTTTSTTETTHSTPAVPELDSLVLFGAGGLGLAGFALYQRRRQRGEA